MPLATRCRVALRRATSSASSDVSVATIATAARSCAIDTATQPLPVQTSAMSGAASRGISASASSTSSSVSGRGISTAGVTSNRSPQNSSCPTMYANGSCATRRSTSACNFAANSGGSS